MRWDQAQVCARDYGLWVRRPWWFAGQYVWWDPALRFMIYYPRNARRMRYHATVSDAQADDWEIYR